MNRFSQRNTFICCSLSVSSTFAIAVLRADRAGRSFLRTYVDCVVGIGWGEVSHGGSLGIQERAKFDRGPEANSALFGLVLGNLDDYRNRVTTQAIELFRDRCCGFVGSTLFPAAGLRQTRRPTTFAGYRHRSSSARWGCLHDSARKQD